MSRYSQLLADLERAGNMRRIPSPNVAGDCAVNLSSNDYLGLAERADLQAEFFSVEANRRVPMTSSASRLLSSRQEEYASLERLLEELYGRKALIFNSGYHANTGLIPALALGGRTLIVADKFAHASMIDGMKLAECDFTRFRHNDMRHLSRILDKEHAHYDTILVVVESVYSMDGDVAPIEALIDLKEVYPKVLLYVDEAHAFGVCGPRGLGLSVASERREDIDVIVGTFGKACASMGAFAAVSDEVRALLVNKARSFIFSTALPPMSAAWSEFMIRRFLEMDAERAHLQSLARRLHGHLEEISKSACSVEASHILPFVVGNPTDTVALSAALRERGFEVLPIRTPTVPPGTDRLRISLSAARTTAEIDSFAEALRECVKR